MANLCTHLFISPDLLGRERGNQNTMNRRYFIQTTAACLLAAYKTSYASCGQTLAIAWDDPTGKHFIGLLHLGTPEPQIIARLEVPTRAHGLVCIPSGVIVAVGRRPGAWLVHWRPHGNTKPQWRWSDETFSFNGHVLPSADQTQLYTTETDTNTAAGYLAQRDARSLQVIRRWPTHGVDPHDLKWLGSNILVANGGVLTQAETGRAKLNAGKMDSSLVLLNAQSGELAQQWRLEDPFLSIRHLAVHANGTVGAALQAEHPEPEKRLNSPVFSLLESVQHELTAIKKVATWNGYAADITALPNGWADA